MKLEDQNDVVLTELSQLDICGWSVLHCLFTRPPIRKVTFLKSYLLPWAAIALLFYMLPLAVVRMAVPEKIIRDSSAGLKVGFLDDWNIMFMYLVTLPAFVILALSERSMVPSRIAKIIRGRAVSIHQTIGQFVSLWNRRYKVVNVLGQLGGVAVAVAVAFANYKTVSMEGFNGWVVADGTVNAAGWVYLCWQIPVFYWIASIYVCQGLATIALLFSLTRNFEIEVSPFHHDNCCGLREVGQIGLRNQYLLAVIGLNILALVAVSIKRGDPRTAGLLVAGVVAYVTLGPLVFIGPLLPFRANMMKAKRTEQARVAAKLQQEYTRIMHELEKRSIAREDEELIDRLVQQLSSLQEQHHWH